MLPTDQQEPQLPWFFTGVMTLRLSVRLYDARGKEMKGCNAVNPRTHQSKVAGTLVLVGRLHCTGVWQAAAEERDSGGLLTAARPASMVSSSGL